MSNPTLTHNQAFILLYQWVQAATSKKGATKRKGKTADDEEIDEFVWEAAKEQLTNSMVHVLEHTCIAQLWKMAAPEEGATASTRSATDFA